jgi:outer membrane protein assembly factor BamD
MTSQPDRESPVADRAGPEGARAGGRPVLLLQRRAFSAIFRPSMRRLAALLLLLAAACGGPHVSLTGDLKYGRSAEDDFKAGEDELKSKNYAEATKFFEHVRTKYPFSKYAALSELRLADARFDQDRFVEAADAYTQFLKVRPTHEQADYAAYRVGLSHWKDGPSEFVLFPPSHEKDLAQVRDAVKALEVFIKNDTYTSSKYRPDAEKILAQAKGMLADHEWYVAEFYVKRGRWAGAAARLQSLVIDYPGSRHEAEALLELAGAYVKTDERFRAQQALQQLIVKHPQDPRRAQAEKLLASLR